MKESIYYVYLHRRETDMSPFYVGKGSGKRAWNFSSRNNFWKNVKNKHGVVVEIAFENLSEEEALQLEKDTILELEYFGYKLTNLTSGGESPKLNDESRRKMSEARMGRKISPESIAKTAAFHTGRKRSEETCRRISEALRGKTIPRERVARSVANRSGTKAKNSDQNKYHFVNLDGVEFVGTRMELCESHLVCKKQISKLFYKCPNKTACGWTLLKEHETISDAVQRIEKSNGLVKDSDELFNFVSRLSGKVLTLNRESFSEYLNTSIRRVDALIYNTSPNKTLFGWGVVQKNETIEECFERIQSKGGYGPSINGVEYGA